MHSIKNNNIMLDKETEIRELQQTQTYKYLGINELNSVQHTQMKEKVRKEYYRRIRLILKEIIGEPEEETKLRWDLTVINVTYVCCKYCCPLLHSRGCNVGGDTDTHKNEVPKL